MDLASLLRVALILFAASPVHAQTVPAEVIRDHPLKLGDSAVTLREYAFGPTLPTIVRVHSKENTAGVVGKNIARELHGRFIDLINRSNRDVSFKLGHTTYYLDPNRIFTREGVQKTLRGSGKLLSLEAVRAVEAFAEHIIELYGKGLPVIALHNNVGTGYGISWYEPGGKSYLGEGKTLLHKGAGHKQNFLIVTTLELFKALAVLGETVVYQDPAYDENDGSMSYYFGKHKIPYVNVEAAYKDEVSQTRSVKRAMEVLAPVAAVANQ